MSIQQTFLSFVAKTECLEVEAEFQALKVLVEENKPEGEDFLSYLKSQTNTHFKTQTFWKSFEEKVASYEQKRKEPISNLNLTFIKAFEDKKFLIVGAGPAGLRMAIECSLAGSKEITVIEKRQNFSRNNVLQLWPFAAHDLRSLSAKYFYPKFCTGENEHIAIWTLQCILLKICLLLGVKFYSGYSVQELIEPTEEKNFWRIKTEPEFPVENLPDIENFNVFCGCYGERFSEFSENLGFKHNFFQDYCSKIGGLLKIPNELKMNFKNEPDCGIFDFTKKLLAKKQIIFKEKNEKKLIVQLLGGLGANKAILSVFDACWSLKEIQDSEYDFKILKKRRKLVKSLGFDYVNSRKLKKDLKNWSWDPLTRYDTIIKDGDLFREAVKH